jgi:hypothetical protein
MRFYTEGDDVPLPGKLDGRHDILVESAVVFNNMIRRENTYDGIRFLLQYGQYRQENGGGRVPSAGFTYDFFSGLDPHLFNLLCGLIEMKLSADYAQSIQIYDRFKARDGLLNKRTVSEETHQLLGKHLP